MRTASRATPNRDIALWSNARKESIPTAEKRTKKKKHAASSLAAQAEAHVDPSPGRRTPPRRCEYVCAQNSPASCRKHRNEQPRAGCALPGACARSAVFRRFFWSRGQRKRTTVGARNRGNTATVCPLRQHASRHMYPLKCEVAQGTRRGERDGVVWWGSWRVAGAGLQRSRALLLLLLPTRDVSERTHVWSTVADTSP